MDGWLLSTYEYYNNSLNEWVIFNRITNNSVAINPLSYYLLKLFESPLDFNAVCTVLRDNGVSINTDRLYKLIVHSVKHDILYAIPQ